MVKKTFSLEQQDDATRHRRRVIAIALSQEGSGMARCVGSQGGKAAVPGLAHTENVNGD